MNSIGVKRPRGRPRGFDTAEALERAMAVFWARGYDGASLDDLTGAMGLARPSVYAAFGDKHGLFLAAVDRYAHTVGSRPVRALLGESDPKRAIEAFFEAVVELVAGCETPRGCLVACVAADTAGCDGAVRERVASIVAATDGAIAGYFRHAHGAGRVRERVDPETLARVLVSLMQGLAIRARAGVSRDELERAAQAATLMLRDLLR